MSGWSIKRVTDEATICELCGREELKRTVLLVTEDGDEIYAGTTCAARKVGVKTADMNRAVRIFNTRLEIARCDFFENFRRDFKMSAAQYVRKYPQHHTVVERMYRKHMQREGFTV